jgi:hypothetical protein
LQGRFTGELFPAPPIADFLKRVLTFIQLMGLVWMIVGGKRILRLLPMYRAGRPLPAFYWTIQDNPVPIALFVYLIAPPILKRMQFRSNMFDIFLNDVLIFSMQKVGALRAKGLADAFIAAGFTDMAPMGK